MRCLTAMFAASVLLASVENAKGAFVTFYTDRASFEAALDSSTTITFEGIVADNQFSSLTPSRVVDGVTFSVSSGTLGISGRIAPVSGSPYDSALLFSNNSAPITANLTTAGSGFTAVGGFFGDIDSAGTSTIMTLVGTTGVLDVRTLTTADMGLGAPHNFFGYIVSGDTIVSVTHNLQGSFEGIDDFTFGVASADNVVPAPPAVVLFAIGAVGLAGGRALRRRMRPVGV